MKSSKLSDYDRRVRREKIMEKRSNAILSHSRSYVQYRTTTFDKHSSDKQRARYARQTGYVAPAPIIVKPKRSRPMRTA